VSDTLLGGIIAVTGIILGTIGTRYHMYVEDWRRIRHEKADRVAQWYGRLLAAAWSMNDISLESIDTPIPDEWKTNISEANYAMLQLSLEDETAASVAKAYKRLATLFQKVQRDKAFLKAHQDVNLLDELWENRERLQSEVAQLESMARRHLTELREPIKPIWIRVWNSTMNHIRGLGVRSLLNKLRQLLRRGGNAGGSTAISQAQ